MKNSLQSKSEQSTGHWQEVEGNVTSLSVNQQSSAFSTNKVNHGFSWNGSAWEQMGVGDNVKKISASAGDAGAYTCGLDPNGNPILWLADQNAFSKIIGGPYDDIAAAGDGYYALSGNTLVRWGPETGGYHKNLFTGPPVQIAAKDVGEVWGVDADGRVYKANLNPKPPAKPGWEQQPQIFTHVAVGAESEIVGVDLAGNVLERRPGDRHWRLLSPTRYSMSGQSVTYHLKSTAVGNSNALWATDVDGRCYQFKRAAKLAPSTNRWELPFSKSKWQSILKEPVGFTQFTGVEQDVYEYFNSVVAAHYYLPSYDIREGYHFFHLRVPSEIRSLLQNHCKEASAKFGDGPAKTVKKILDFELHNVENVVQYFEALMNIITVNHEYKAQIATIISDVIGAEKNPPPASFSFLDIIFAILGFGLGMFLGAAGEAISDVVASAIEGALEVISATTMFLLEPGEAGDGWEGRNPLEATEAAINQAMLDHYATLRTGISNKRDFLLSSETALDRAGSIFNNLKSSLADLETHVPNVLAAGFRVSMYQMLLPVRFQIVTLSNLMADGTYPVLGPPVPQQQISIWKQLNSALGKGVLNQTVDNKTYSFIFAKIKSTGNELVAGWDPTTWLEPLDFASESLLGKIFDPPEAFGLGGGLGADPKAFFLGAGRWGSISHKQGSWSSTGSNNGTLYISW